MTKVLVCGGRHYADYNRVWKVLDAAIERLGLTEIVHGDCPSGADSLADAWAGERGITAKRYPANWTDLSRTGAIIRTRSDGEKYDATAGGVRNETMLEFEKPEIVIAFRGGSGTLDCVKRAEAKGIRVIKIDWDA